MLVLVLLMWVELSSRSLPLTPMPLTTIQPLSTIHVQGLLKGRRGQLLPESQVVALFIQICLALKHIHDRKVGRGMVGLGIGWVQVGCRWGAGGVQVG